jgi:hypothetical protein
LLPAQAGYRAARKGYAKWRMRGKSLYNNGVARDEKGDNFCLRRKWAKAVGSLLINGALGAAARVPAIRVYENYAEQYCG